MEQERALPEPWVSQGAQSFTVGEAQVRGG